MNFGQAAIFDAPQSQNKTSRLKLIRGGLVRKQIPFLIQVVWQRKQPADSGICATFVVWRHAACEPMPVLPVVWHTACVLDQS